MVEKTRPDLAGQSEGVVAGDMADTTDDERQAGEERKPTLLEIDGRTITCVR